MSDNILELPAGQIKVGHCVIMNSTDKPCARLIALVSQDTGTHIIGAFLTDGIRQHSVRGPKSHATPINHFGYRVYYNGQYLSVRPDQTLEIVATYANGKSRIWQPEGGTQEESVPVKGVFREELYNYIDMASCKTTNAD